MQDAQDDRNGSVINRNQRNQSQSALSQASMRDYDVNCVINRNQSRSATTQVSNDIGQFSPTWIDYADYDDGVINRNQRNQSDLQHSQATLRVEQRESNSALHANSASAGKARASPSASSKKRCPHHPHARWIRFDPSGQTWCDKMNCWDCYRLMKIGEALGYRPLAEYTRGIVKLEQGRVFFSVKSEKTRRLALLDVKYSLTS